MANEEQAAEMSTVAVQTGRQIRREGLGQAEGSTSMIRLTYPGADGHEHVANDFGVVHHDCFHRPIQHADLQGSLFLLVLQGVLPMICH